MYGFSYSSQAVITDVRKPRFKRHCSLIDHLRWVRLLRLWWRRPTIQHLHKWDIKSAVAPESARTLLCSGGKGKGRGPIVASERYYWHHSVATDEISVVTGLNETVFIFRRFQNVKINRTIAAMRDHNIIEMSI